MRDASRPVEHPVPAAPVERSGPAAPACDLRIAGCEIAIEGSVTHDADDTWDANWLSVTARCRSADASVVVQCAVLTSWSVERFLEGLMTIARTGSGSAHLASERPCLSLCLSSPADDGAPRLRVDLSADPDAQGHWFVYPVTASAIEAAIEQCRAILAAYPAHELSPSD